ncbi:MAG: hypothetical protein JRN27_06795 [Nitrososphaerota archaeon]|jgi:hypothetical protein|nr:hypothetical protein [Nitrososphaerota archaeon]MDG6975779.1 hypothetical protein [Nitrososphaerota archaeon]
MAEKRDDFAWIFDLLGKREGRAAPRSGEGYETVDQIFERRTRQKRTWKAVARLIIQLLPLIIMVVLLYLA